MEYRKTGYVIGNPETMPVGRKKTELLIFNVCTYRTILVAISNNIYDQFGGGMQYVIGRGAVEPKYLQ